MKKVHCRWEKLCTLGQCNQPNRSDNVLGLISRRKECTAGLKQVDQSLSAAVKLWICDWCLLLFGFSRRRHLLWLVYPWGGEARLGSDEEQGGSRHWAQPLGGLPKQGSHDAANVQLLPPHASLFNSHLSVKLGPNSCLAGQSFSLADVTVFPTVGTLFRFGWERRVSRFSLEDTTKSSHFFRSAIASFCFSQLVSGALS